MADYLAGSKVGTLVASMIAGVVGTIILISSADKSTTAVTDNSHGDH